MATGIKIGWIGCGVMGRWMLQHVMDAGYPAFVYSRTPSKCQPLIDRGAILCNSPTDVALETSLIFTILGYPKDVQDVILGTDGILETWKKENKKNAIIIDMTTSKPELARRIAMEMEGIGCHGVDAPVSGGDIGARECRLSIMAGATETAFNKISPILSCMAAKGGKIIHTGPPGSGQDTKMTNQILIATNIIGVVEALLYAQKSGLDVEKTLAAVSSGAAGSWSLSNYGPRMIKRDFEPGFAVEHFVKDMEIALDEARRMNLCLPGLALAHQLYVGLKAQGEGRKGTQALLLGLERMNGIQKE